MRITETADMVIQEFDGATDLAESLRTLEGKDYVRTSFFHDEIKENCPQTHESPLRNLVDGLRQNWTEGVAIIESMLAELGDIDLPKPTSRRRVSRWQEEGDEFDRDRAESDFPAWRGTHRANRHAPAIVTVIADITTPSTKETEEILWRGAAAIILAKLLEDAGYRVELKAAKHCTSAWDFGNKGIVAIMRLKQAGEPLDISSIATSISGWAYRAGWLTAYNFYGKPSDSFGLCRPIKDVVDQDATIAKDIWSRRQAIDWIRGCLSKSLQPCP